MNILLIDDHPIFRFGVRQTLQQRWPEAVIGEADSLQAGLAAVREGSWTVVVLDLGLPDAGGVESVARLHRAAPDLRLLVLSFHDEAAYARQVLRLGAAGYLTKSRAPEELIGAIERIAAGGRYISAVLAEQLAYWASRGVSNAPHEALSTREYRVLLQLAAGRRVGEIAAAMHLSPKTVSTYRSRILDKLGLAGNLELARYCSRHGLSDDPL